MRACATFVCMEREKNWEGFRGRLAVNAMLRVYYKKLSEQKSPRLETFLHDIIANEQLAERNG